METVARDSEPTSSADAGLGLRTRATGAARWVFASHAVEQGLATVRIVVLARLLLPQDFGVVGMAALMLSAIESLSHPALDSVLVREPWTQEDLDTAWTMNMARSVLIGAVTWALAPILAAFFAVPMVVPLARVLILSVLLRGAVNVAAQASLATALRFSRLTAIDMVGMVIGTAASIALAILWRSVWALVAGTIAGEVARTAASFILFRDHPRLRFSWTAARRLMGLGRWFAGTNALIYLATNLDDVLVGRVLGSASLGLYQVAYRISNLPVTAISHVANRVAFPVYALLRGEPARLRSGYRQVLEAVAALAVPATMVLILAGRDAAHALLGPHWAEAGLLIQSLAVFGLIRAMAGAFGVLIQAAGSPQLVTRASAAQLVVMTPLLFWLVPQRGLGGAVLAVIAGGLISWLVAGVHALRLLNWQARDYLEAVWRPFASGALGLVAGGLAGRGLEGVPPLVSLLIVTSVATIVYLGVVSMLRSGRRTRLARPGTMLRWRALGGLLRMHARGVVVDVGGHDGWMLSRLGRRGVVLDRDPAAVAIAVSDGQRAVVGSAERLPFRDQTVQTVLCLDTIEHVTRDEVLLGECARVLRPGGRLILTTPRIPMRLAPFVDMARLEQLWGHVRSGYGDAELDALCVRHGLRVVSHDRYFNVISRWVYALLYLRGPGVRLPTGLRLVLLGWVGRLEPLMRWGGAEHVVVAERLP